MARPGRFELPTSCSGGKRSIQLSYGRAAKYFVKSSASFRSTPVAGFEGRHNSLLPYPFERFLISCASFSISSAFFTRFSESTFDESVLSTSAFNSAASL